MWWYCLDQWFVIPHLHLNEKYIGNFEMIDFIEVWWAVVFFLNVMILSGPMICDSSFTSECEKFIVSFEMIDSIEVSTNSCDFSLMWWFCLDQWFMIPHFHLNVKNLSWVWNDRLPWGLDEQLWFFLNVMILSRKMIYDPHFHLNMKNTSWNLKW